MGQTNVVLLYQYFHPDDVVSARLFSDIAVELSGLGCLVTAMPSVRSCHSDKQAFPKEEEWEGGRIQRAWRPAWKQASNKGRLGNALFMLAVWSWRAFATRRRPAETVIIGTDPVLSVLVAIPWRLFRPNARIVHWCHDAYPHAAVADGLLAPNSLVARILNRLLGFAYRRCDVIADLGPCMRRLLVLAEKGVYAQVNDRRAAELSDNAAFQCPDRFITVTPWSLVEPHDVVVADSRVRENLFGDADLGLLYSGNLGRAHEYELLLKLARSMSEDSAAFCFAGRGARMDELREATEGRDANVRFAGFASEAELDKRLGAADVHMVSLRDEWTGTVVPSKFFGALAAGRPVLFAGSPDAGIAKWIEQYQVGWLLTKENVSDVATALRSLSQSAAARAALNAHCHRIYHEVFSKARQMAKLAACMQIEG